MALTHIADVDLSTHVVTLDRISNFQSRFVVREVCVGIIEQLHDADIAVVFALDAAKVIFQNEECSQPSCIVPIDLLKYLVRQVVIARRKFATEKAVAFQCAAFHDATTERELFQILEAVPAEFGCEVYVVVDFALLGKTADTSKAFSWVQAFCAIFRNLALCGLQTAVKIVMVSCGSLPFHITDRERLKFVVRAKSQVLMARQRKMARLRIYLHPTQMRLKGLPKSDGTVTWVMRLPDTSECI